MITLPLWYVVIITFNLLLFELRKSDTFVESVVTDIPKSCELTIGSSAWATSWSLHTAIYSIGVWSAVACLDQALSVCLTNAKLGTAISIFFAEMSFAIQYAVRLFPEPQGWIIFPRSFVSK